MIKKDCKKKYEFSSNRNEGIRAVPFFLRKDFTHTKSTKPKQATFTQMFFFAHIKHKKHKKYIKVQNVKQAIFFFLDVFYTHKNAVFFVLHTKSTKSTKST